MGQVCSHVQALHSTSRHVSFPLFLFSSFCQPNLLVSEANSSDGKQRREDGTTSSLRRREESENPSPARAEPQPLMALNHVSRLCRDVKKSLEFYTKVLGFVLIERPSAFDFDGAWLFNYGVGIHLVQAMDNLDHLANDRLPHNTDHLDPMDNHISFRCEDMNALEQRLKEMNVKCIKRTVEDESGTGIHQLFFSDPDGFMVEICNCENLKLVPADSPDRLRFPEDHHNPPVALSDDTDSIRKPANVTTC